jgi:hypothetical protein
VGADGQVGGDHRRGRRQRRHLVLGAVGLEVGQVGGIAAAGVGGGVGGRRFNRQAQVLLRLVAGQVGRDLRGQPRCQKLGQRSSGVGVGGDRAGPADGGGRVGGRREKPCGSELLRRM